MQVWIVMPNGLQIGLENGMIGRVKTNEGCVKADIFSCQHAIYVTEVRARWLTSFCDVFAKQERLMFRCSKMLL